MKNNLWLFLFLVTLALGVSVLRGKRSHTVAPVDTEASASEQTREVAQPPEREEASPSKPSLPEARPMAPAPRPDPAPVEASGGWAPAPPSYDNPGYDPNLPPPPPTQVYPDANNDEPSQDADNTVDGSEFGFSPPLQPPSEVSPSGSDDGGF